MRQYLLAASIMPFIAGCGEKSATLDSKEDELHVVDHQKNAGNNPAKDSLAARQSMSSPVFDVRKIAGASEAEVVAVLGPPISCGTVKQGRKCSFQTAETEVIFISGKADWISVESLDGAPYSSEILPMLGFEQTAPSFSNEHVIRWNSIPGFLEVSAWPAGKGVDMVYIKTATP